MATPSRLLRAITIAATAALLLPAAVLAAPPEHSPSALADLELAAGEACDFGVVLSNPGANGHDIAFAPHRDGSQRFSSQGLFPSRATNIQTGRTIYAKGGAAITYRFAEDGSLVADARGLNFAWYLPGDDSDLGAGLWLVRGHAQEVYDADGNFVRATFSGAAIDACEALAG